MPEYITDKERAAEALLKASEIRADIFRIKYATDWRNLLYFPYKHYILIARKYNKLK